MCVCVCVCVCVCFTSNGLSKLVPDEDCTRQFSRVFFRVFFFTIT